MAPLFRGKLVPKLTNLDGSPELLTYIAVKFNLNPT